MKNNLFALLLSLNIGIVCSQRQEQYSSAEIFQGIKKLNVLNNILYLAAHPDDENTRLIAYCVNEKLYNTAYLSITRGDGGQNLVGSETGDELGIIRTQELLAARRIDGAQQFFTSAVDFGFSKTANETLEIWDKEKILADIVWVIRKFRPDIIVCRFPPDNRAGHGHHTASALLGIEAFDLASDKTKFSEQLKWVAPWQPKRIVVNTGRWLNEKIGDSDSGVVSENIGLFNSLRGFSYNELAAKSRTMHKSQGFGTTGTRGELIEYFEHLKGEQAKRSIFDGTIDGWSRVEGSERVQKLVTTLISTYNIEKPEESIAELIALRKAVIVLNDEYWKMQKLKEIDNLIKQCAGIYLDAKANANSACGGDSLSVTFELIARNKSLVLLNSICSSQLDTTFVFSNVLVKNKVTEIKKKILVPSGLAISQPYWLVNKGGYGTYNISKQELIGTAENEPAINFNINITIEGQVVAFDIPLIYRWNDPVKGELYRPFVIIPPVFLNFSQPIQIFTTNISKTIELTIKSVEDDFSGVLELSAPEGWMLDSKKYNIGPMKNGEELKLNIIIKHNGSPLVGNLTATIIKNKSAYNRLLKTINYDHIPPQVYMPESEVKLVYVPITKIDSKIAYLPGAGDRVSEALRNIGYTVDELTEDNITEQNLKKYTTVIVGIRALNTNERIDIYMPILLNYCKEGGNLIMQYNTEHQLKTKHFSPYPIKLSKDRVTEENSSVSFLHPNHPVLNTPNKITENDFKGWVQERGLYFPNQWDKQYDAILSWHDKDENAKNGSLLIAKYGKGNYIYTGISFFRELPAGVPGAYRLMVNLISLKNEKQ